MDKLVCSQNDHGMLHDKLFQFFWPAQLMQASPCYFTDRAVAFLLHTSITFMLVYCILNYLTPSDWIFASIVVSSQTPHSSSGDCVQYADLFVRCVCVRRVGCRFLPNVNKTLFVEWRCACLCNHCLGKYFALFMSFWQFCPCGCCVHWRAASWAWSGQHWLRWCPHTQIVCKMHTPVKGSCFAVHGEEVSFLYSVTHLWWSDY